MGPRASRRRVITISDDEDDSAQPEDVAKQPPKPQKRGSGTAKASINGKLPSRRSTKTTSLAQSPRKASSTATPAGSNKEPPKPSAKPIYSFFNSATQRQQTSQPSPNRDKLASLHEDVEAIHDDLDEDQPENVSKTTLSKGSSTALAMRKRKFQRAQSFEDSLGIPSAPSASQKFRKTGDGGRVSSMSVKNDDRRPWSEQFAPIDLCELAVHKRKVADVRSWLEMVYRGRRSKVLVLKGAAGSGKTTTVQLLAKDLGIRLTEWKDTTSSDYVSENFVSASTRFEEFVARAGKSAGLTLCSAGQTPTQLIEMPAQDDDNEFGNHPQALLIEEFPNTFTKSSAALQSFRSTILHYLSSANLNGRTPIPIIMVISETLLSTNTASADSFTAHRLLGPELTANPYVNIIEFNPVAPTILTKALESIVVKEARKSGRRRTPGPQVLKHLAEIGDIRSAVSTLEFLCLRGDDGNSWSSKVSFTKPKQTKNQPPLTEAEEEALKLISNRESSLGIFHSVGKVVYNKRTIPAAGESLAQPPPWLNHHWRHKIPETNADSLIDELGTDTSTFMAALHENYALSCSCANSEKTLDCLSGCMDNLSDSDLLSLDRFSFGNRAFSGSATDGLRQDDMCFQVGVRGILFSLPNPVHRSSGASGSGGDAFRMHYPASRRLWRRKEEIEDNLLMVSAKLSSSSGIGSTKATSNEDLAIGGVESWKRSKAFATKTNSPDDASVSGPSPTSSEAKNEMLTDRLPYLALILEGSKAFKSSPSLLDLVQSVTRISSAAPVGDDEVDAEDGEDANNGTEAWATDGPDVDAASTSISPKKKVIPSKKKQVFEAMSIPVETRVERLVLEDDDIVDT